MESDRHREQMVLLIDTLREAWRDRWDYYAGGNQAVYFSETQARNQDFRAPDFFLVLDVERRERDGWVVWDEDGRMPDVVIELLSPSTEANDRGRKKQVYERVLRVPFYAMYDPFTGVLEAFALDVDDRTYHPLPFDEQGRVWCAPVKMFLGVRDLPWKGMAGPWLRWIDRDGQPLQDGAARADEAERRAAEAAERAAEAAERAAREAARADQAEAELARLRAELARRS